MEETFSWIRHDDFMLMFMMMLGGWVGVDDVLVRSACERAVARSPFSHFLALYRPTGQLRPAAGPFSRFLGPAAVLRASCWSDADIHEGPVNPDRRGGP